MGDYVYLRIYTYIHTYIICTQVYPLLFKLVCRSDGRQLLLNGDIRCRDDIDYLKGLLFDRFVLHNEYAYIRICMCTLNVIQDQPSRRRL